MATIPVIVPRQSLTPSELRELILHKLKEPTIFKGFLEGQWVDPLTWSPKIISNKLSDVNTKFKVCPKPTATEYQQFTSTEVVYETHCQYINASFGEFKEWLSSTDTINEPASKKQKTDKRNPLFGISKSSHWVYADYKYMNELCVGHPDLISAIDWSVFGFESRNGNQSTLWIGSEGSCTPCHYDTYGCNLVAQLWGTKEWTLYHPADNLYPTRIPYEESSIFSLVNLKTPQVEKYPLFLRATPHKVVLHPGDVLFIPHQWWHYVECIEPSVSVNTWLDMPQKDNEERVKEAVVRTLVSSIVTPDQITTFINPNEEIFPLEDNLELLSVMLGNKVSTTNFINAITSNKVLAEIIKQLKGNVPIQ